VTSALAPTTLVVVEEEAAERSGVRVPVAPAELVVLVVRAAAGKAVLADLDQALEVREPLAPALRGAELEEVGRAPVEGRPSNRLRRPRRSRSSNPPTALFSVVSATRRPPTAGSVLQGSSPTIEARI